MGEEGGLAAQLGQAAGRVGGGAVGAVLLRGGGGLVGRLGGHRGPDAPGLPGLLAGLPQGGPHAGGQRQAQGQGDQPPVSTQKSKQEQGHAQGETGNCAGNYALISASIQGLRGLHTTRAQRVAPAPKGTLFFWGWGGRPTGRAAG